MPSATVSARYELAREGAGTLGVRVSGRWAVAEGVPPVEPIAREIEAGAQRLVFESDSLESWDSALVTFMYAVAEAARSRGVDVELGTLPDGLRRLGRDESLPVRLLRPPDQGVPVRAAAA